MTKLEILNEIRTKKLQVAEILDSIESEKRTALNKETVLLENIKAEIQELEVQLRVAEKEPVIKVGENRADKKFSLLTAINDIVEGRQMNEATLEMNARGRKTFTESGLSYKGQIVLPNFEQRAEIVANTANAGQEAIVENKMNLIGALYANSVIGQLGATVMYGVKGTLSLPIYAGSSSAWATETGAASDGGGAFSELTLEPRRLTTYIDVSKSFLGQDTSNAEQVLLDDLNTAILSKVENTMFDATAGSTSRPAGLFNGASYTSTLTGTTTWAKVVGMESAVDTSNALIGSLGYLIHPSTNGVFKTTAKASNQAIFVREGNAVNGYPVMVTSNMPTIATSYKGAIFANWKDLVVANFAGSDITIDPYSQAINGKVRIVVNTYWNWTKRRSASFSLNYLA